MKKLVSIFLALIMILGLTTTAFAEDNNQFTLTITGTGGHTYKVYQIFTGDVAKEGDKTVLSNVYYGENYGDKDVKVPDKLLEDFSKATDLEDILKNGLHGEPIILNADGKETTVSVTVEAGYYMVVDATAVLPDGQTRGQTILRVLESVTIAAKHASISSEKKVDDKNDSNTSEDEANWQDSADYDFGDAVPFQLSVTLPTTLTTYRTYEITFHDQQAAGFDTPVITAAYILKADGTTKITIPEAADGTNGYTFTNYCTKTDTCEFGGCSFNIHVGDVKALYGQNTFAEGDKIVVEYTSVLKDTATVGKEGNLNGMYVCHPDGHTPKDYVTVLTYELAIDKIDGGTKENLTGVGFTLYKWIAAENDWVKVGEEIKGDDISHFVWSGIDGGKYKLEESFTPAGYNTIEPIEFLIDATHKADWIPEGGNTAFLDVLGKNLDGTVVEFPDRNADGVEDGKLQKVIENYKGTILPETGAQGTVALIAGGSLLVIVAAVFMITRKKMSIYAD